MATPQILPGLALIASVVTTGDAVVPQVGLAVPQGSQVGQTTAFFWNAIGVATFEISGTNGYSSGMLSAAEAVGVVYAPPFESSGDYSFTIDGYDADGHTLVYTSIPVTIT